MDEGAKRPYLQKLLYTFHVIFMQLVSTEHSKVKEVIYAVSQTICNRFVLSAVSFQINLWQSPSYTDSFSWVFFFPLFEILFQLDMLLETISTAVVICADVRLFHLWVVLHGAALLHHLSITVIAGHSVLPGDRQLLERK